MYIVTFDVFMPWSFCAKHGADDDYKRLIVTVYRWTFTVHSGLRSVLLSGGRCYIHCICRLTTSIQLQQQVTELVLGKSYLYNSYLYSVSAAKILMKYKRYNM